MEKKFRDIIKRLAGEQQAVIAAVSAGLDSVVLARLLHDSGHLAAVAHCNFRLRGEEAEADARFVAQLAERLGVPYHLQSFDTTDYAQAHGISLQMAARELRYNWFRQLAEAQQALVATAHQANDVAETLLFNLTKGTGLPGLHGLDERQGYLLRPLLAFSRTEILQFAREQQIDWREDASNQSLKYQRNRLRHKIVPELEQINPAFVQAAGRTAQRLRLVETFVQGIIDRSSFIEQRGNHLIINLAELSKLPGWQAVLYQALRPLGFNYAQIDQIAAGPHQSGKLFTSPTHQLNIDRQ
ncbi:MAG TPA: tRNA lysidine(34) synthetase TilS, partial [Flammeovirgaceae bacterium]|nr:tRNA lysidine(34) synthetase TilS [Flammeovirgaceae bacterium]